jgi:hypothetical protein
MYSKTSFKTSAKGMTKKIMTEKLERSHSLEQNQYDWLLRKNI